MHRLKTKLQNESNFNILNRVSFIIRTPNASFKEADTI